ncbi:hypothetical protein CEE37_12180 [candidate division LCP-89 bacterium B3_LCP]|uniref:Secretion system C-terminal sorting domain-containing protein n=1 Tax=candidate division LCP-89 bacterium B3_LCP TaxID=2012998 RepID=A0A532UU99_UNCL8|nr:MAG: hypothetical protein CEE37_12180 [candidate division LCP-89 bacterium B3_LCP]
MMKRSIFLTLVFTFLSASILGADTIIYGGAHSGTWTETGSRYLVQGDIWIESNATLTIEPGVTVIFQTTDNLEFTVYGTLIAEGSFSNPILFGADEDEGWRGIRFEDASSSSSLKFCRLTNGIVDGAYEEGYGGAIYCENSSPSIDNCLISDCQANWGGAIYTWDDSAPEITRTIIARNSADYGGGIRCNSCDANETDILENFVIINEAAVSGGGIYQYDSATQIIGNIISGNLANDYPNTKGGGIYFNIGDTESLISKNIISKNEVISSLATYGAGIYGKGDDEAVEISYNLIYDNDASDSALNNGYGGGIYLHNCDPTLISNSIVYNTANFTHGGGIESYYGAHPEMINSILWGNSPTQITLSGNPQGTMDATYCDIQGGWTGTGNINSDPEFLDVSEGEFRFEYDSPCQDSGDPTSTYEPDNTRIDMGAYYYDQTLDIRLTVSPDHPPMIFSTDVQNSRDINFRVYNKSQSTHSVTVSAKYRLPDGRTTTVGQPTTFSLAGGSMNTIERTFTMASGSSWGIYSFIAEAEITAGTAIDSFLFAIVTPDPDDSRVLSMDESQYFLSNQSPTVSYVFALHQNTPNPFNPLTVLSYQLQNASLVNLTVYDISGREVAELVSGWRDVGVHEVTFDGSALPSGLYVYHLKAGDFTASGKMVLVK